MRLTKLIAALAMLPATLVWPQQAPAVHFDVASVKPGDPSFHGQMVRPGPGRYHAENLTLLSLVLGAYRINQNQLIGGPNWLTSTGWDIEATFPVTATPGQQQQMMQALLAERFGLVVHRETRNLPTYELSVAKSGLKLKTATDPFESMSAGPRMIRYTSVTMTEFANQLSSYLERQVTDKTGLTDHYGIDLRFVPVDARATSDATEAGPTIFTALQEQLGLKLDSTRGPVEVIVIDKADKPGAN